ncbi:unnamed protein product [Caenorhabditis nigoni]
MNDAIVKKEVIEKPCNFTFKNEGFVEVKQEEVEQKPENLLEQEIKTEPIDFFENNNSEELCEDVELKPEESESEIRKMSIEINKLKCTICHKIMPKNLLKLIKSEGDKTVISEIFKGALFLDTNPIYVCVSHIQMIIDENDGKVKSPTNRYEQLLGSFVTKNKKLIKVRTSLRRYCQVCHTAKTRSEYYENCSKGIRMVIMVGCILRGTYSIEQAKSYTMIKRALTCYSHCKDSIGTIFEYLGVRTVLELSKCSTLAMDNLMNIVKRMDSNFTVDQFIDAFRGLFLKNQKFHNNR